MTAGRLRIRAGFVLLIAALVYLDEGYLLWIVFGAALLHELGHLIPLYLFGGRVSRLELTGGGIGIETEFSAGYGRELAAVLAGPVSSLVFALLFSLRDGMIREQAALAGMCLSHGVFNLLPMRGLDGGRALELMLDAGGIARARDILRVTTVVCSAALGIVCGALAVLHRNVSMLLALIYVLTSCTLKTGPGGKR